MFKKKLKIFNRLFYKNVDLTRSLSEKGDICPEQLKAARSLLDWSQEDLSQKSGYSLATINNIERGQYNAHSTTMADIVQTFEQAGVQFIDGPGVKIEEADFRIKAYWQLPETFRSLLRLSSPSNTKASTKCPSFAFLIIRVYKVMTIYRIKSIQYN